MRLYRTFAALLFVGAGTSSLAQTPPSHALMPQPSEIHAGSGSPLAITGSLSVSVTPASSAPLREAANRMMRDLSTASGITIASPLQSSGTITIHVDDASSTTPKLHDDESYRLVADGGHVSIQAKTLWGAYRGIATLTQLAQPSSTGWVIPPVEITDSPRFPWRGLMLDSGRHFLPVETVLRTLDGMASVKLNVFHFHLSEDQGFRIESKRFPKLHQMGSEGQFYTQDEIRRIVAYATARGIRVVPEFDIPGHSTSWFVGYPELASVQRDYKVDHTFGVKDPAFDPSRESTYQFLDEFFGEMTTLFPDEYVHIGGDESNGKDWKSNRKIVAFMKDHNLADTHALQAYFSKRVQEILKKHGKKVAGWDEILHPDLPSDVVVQVWHNAKFVVSSAKAGHLAFYSHPWYLDHNYTASEMYASDPIPDGADLTDAQRKLILGGEACMWGEHITSDTIDSRIWPRAAVVAERLWSPQQLRDSKDMHRRLLVEELRLDALGLQHISGAEQRLRHLAQQGEPAQPIRAFWDALEMPDFPERSRLLRPTTDTPMTNLVDSLRPDPPSKYRIAHWMDDYLNAPDAATRDAARFSLNALFASWVSLSPDLDRLAVSRPAFAAAEVRRAEWPKLGVLGLQMMKAYDSKQHLSAQQGAEASALLKESGTAIVELANFVAIEPMQKLLAATK